MFGKLKMLLYLATKLEDMTKIGNYYVIQDLSTTEYLDSDNYWGEFKHAKWFKTKKTAKQHLITNSMYGAYNIIKLHHVYYDIP